MHQQRSPASQPPTEPVAGHRPATVGYGRPSVRYQPLVDTPPPGHVVPAGRLDRQARALMLCFEMLDLAEGAAREELEYMAWRLSKTAQQLVYLTSMAGPARHERSSDAISIP